MFVARFRKRHLINMFANFATPTCQASTGNQPTNLSTSSPFAVAMQKTNQNNSGTLFQSPNQNSFMGANSTPSLFQNNTSTNVVKPTQPFSFGQTATFGTNTFGNTSTTFSAPSSVGVFGQTQPNTQSTSLFGQPQNNTTSSQFGQKPAQSFGGFGTLNTNPTNSFQTQPSLFSNPNPSTSRPDSLFAQTQTGTSTWGQPQTNIIGMGGSSIPLGSSTSAFSSSVVSSAPSSSFTSVGFSQQQPASGNPIFGSQPVQNPLFQTTSTNNNTFNFPKPTFGTSVTTASSGFGQLGNTSLFNTGSSLFGNNAAVTTQGNTFNQFGSSFPPSNTGFTGSNTNTTFNATNTSLFPTSAPASTGIGFGQQSTLSWGQPQNAITNIFGASQPQPVKQSIFGSSQPTNSFVPATSTIFPQQPAFPSFSQPATNIFGGPSQPSFGAVNQNIASSNAPGSTSVLPYPSIFQTSTAQSTQGTYIPQAETYISLLQRGIDKEVDIFGYKSTTARLGDFNYYNTDYRMLPNTKDISEQAVRIVGTGNSDYNPAPLYSLSNINYSSNLKLGTVINPNSDKEFPEPPLDTITKLRFSNYNQELIACASWDSSVRVWRRRENVQFISSGCNTSVTGVAFDIAWAPNDCLALACSDGSVTLLDVLTNQKTILGRHSGPVKSVVVTDIDNNGIVSGSWDSTIKCWDIRMKSAKCSLTVDGKVIGLACKGSSLVVLTSNNSVKLFDAVNPSREIKKFSLSTNAPLRCVGIQTLPQLNSSASQKRSTIAVGSTAGRIYVETFNTNSSVGATSISFRCHRISSPRSDDVQNAYPIHDFSFYPSQSVLASAGGDGVVCFWDIASRGAQTLNRSSLPVTSLTFSGDGKTLAYAVGYDWSKGIMSYNYAIMKPAIFFRKIEDRMFSTSKFNTSSNFY